MKPSLATRRARVARVNAKRPRGVVVEAIYKPNPAARERLLDLLVELLDAAGQSGGR
jgi:hypothetical protein